MTLQETDRRTNGQTGGQTNVQTDGPTDIRTDQQACGRINKHPLPITRCVLNSIFSPIMTSLALLGFLLKDFGGWGVKTYQKHKFHNQCNFITVLGLFSRTQIPKFLTIVRCLLVFFNNNSNFKKKTEREFEKVANQLERALIMGTANVNSYCTMWEGRTKGRQIVNLI